MTRGSARTPGWARSRARRPASTRSSSAPQSLEGADLFGACTLTVSVEEGGVYTTANIDVVVSPGDGSVQPLLFQNVVLFRPEDVGGRLYWTDDGPTAAAPACGRRASGSSRRERSRSG